MKRCPQCRRDYYDESLSYCLDDGTALLEGPATTGSEVEGTSTAIFPRTAAGSDDDVSLGRTRPIENAIGSGSGLRGVKDSPPRQRWSWIALVLLAAAGIAVVAGAIAVYRLAFKKPPPFQSVKISKLT